MTKEEIIEMAKQAGILHESDTAEIISECGVEVWLSPSDGVNVLETFAKLVAQHEREAIAQMVEDAPPLMEFAQNHQGGCLMCGFTPKQAAEVIRARGQA